MVKRLIKYSVVLLVLLIFRELIAIVYQYRWYFPPNFHAPGFLAGREPIFHGTYRIAFYLHIVSGPFTILIGMFLCWSGNRNFRIEIHRVLGKVQFLLVTTILVPSGLVMTTRTHTGFLAGAGLAILALLTLASTILTLVHIRRGELVQHRLWSSRLIIMLLSPILLRMMSTMAGVFEIQSHETYQFNVWISWLVPLIAFEIWRVQTTRTLHRDSNNQLENVA